VSIHLAILLSAVAAAGFNICLALQKTAALRLEKLTFPPTWRQLKGFLTSGRWLAAYSLAVASWVLMLIAVAHAPISIVYPIQGFGLVVMAVFAVFYLKERLATGEWLGVAMLIAGMGLLGVSASEHEAGSLQSVQAVRLVLFSVGLLGLTMLAWLMEKKSPGRFNLEMIIGAVGGVLMGIASMISRITMLEYNAGHFWAFFWFLMLMGSLNIAGDFTQQGGFQRGRAMTVVSVRLVTTKLVALVGGFLALGEALPGEPLALGLRIAALTLLLFGTVLLSRFSLSPVRSAPVSSAS
jgi:multidrug transporter EmrE-like cation transporter